MFLHPSKDNMTTGEIVKEIKDMNVFKCLEDKTKGLYIFYNEDNLLNKNHFDSKNLFKIKNLLDTSLSIKELKDLFSGNPNEKQEDCNCKNKEALDRIDKLEKVITSIIHSKNPEKIFDYLPYTKQGKFSKTGNINLYIPNIKSTFSGEYFSQTEIALQLIPLEMPKPNGNCLESIHSGDICFLEINDRASFTSKKRPENIIDEDGNYKKVNKPSRNSYLKQDEIEVGTSYIDAKGSEYLYIGEIKENGKYEGIDCDGNPYSGSIREKYEGLYLRVTSKISKELENCTSFEDFLYDRFYDSFIKNEMNFQLCLNRTTTKKFVKKGTVYFDNEHNKISNKLLFEFPKGTIKDFPNSSYSIKLKIN